MSNERIAKFVVVIAALGAVVALGAAGGALSSKNLAASSAMTTPTAMRQNRTLPGSFSEIIKRVGPAVVSISVTGTNPRARLDGGQGAMPPVPEPFKRFFDEEFGKRFRSPHGTPNAQQHRD